MHAESVGFFEEFQIEIKRGLRPQNNTQDRQYTAFESREYTGYQSNFYHIFWGLHVPHVEGEWSLMHKHLDEAMKQPAFLDFLKKESNQALLREIDSHMDSLIALYEHLNNLMGLYRARRKIHRSENLKEEDVYYLDLLKQGKMMGEAEVEKMESTVWSAIVPLFRDADERMKLAGVDTSKFTF